MTDQEWQAGIERALTAAWRHGWGDDLTTEANIEILANHRLSVKLVANELSKTLGLRVALIYTRVDEIGRFRVGPARDEEA